VTAYVPRTVHLPDRRQTYLHLPGVRPNWGPCPGCGAEEDVYCDSGCDLTDPFAMNVLSQVSRCWNCMASEKASTTSERRDLLVLPFRPKKHLTADGSRSLCGRASRPKAILYRSQPW
jgi:hypothetical protein